MHFEGKQRFTADQMIRVRQNADHDSDRFTVGTVLQTLSSIAQSRHTSGRQDKNIIRENVIRALQQEDIFKSRFYLDTKQRKISSSNFTALRQSLKEQVEISKTNPKKAHYVYSRKDVYLSKDELNSVSLPLEQDAQSQKSIILEHDEEKGVQSLYVDNVSKSGESDAVREMLIKRNVYSRYLHDNTKDSELFSSENDMYFEGYTGLSAPSEESQQRHRRKSRRESTASSIISNTSTTSRKRSQSQASEEIKQQEKDKNKSENEDDFISSISDPTLKDSMQKIIQRRKSVLCLFKSSGGLRVLSENEAYEISPIEEESSSVAVSSDFESETLKSESSFNFDEVKSDAEKYGLRLQGTSDTDGGQYLRADLSLPMSAKTDARRKGILKQTPRQNSRFTHKSHSARTISTRNKIETEETKVILPLSTNAWRPTLVPKQVKKRSNTAYSCPETRKEKKKILAEKSKDDAIRDFIIMYAKVKNNRQADQADESDCQPDVRMISQTPEFVVKSAIGQFLTVPFPSETNNNGDSIEEKHEAKQRTKLIKMKNCMLQLADLA